MRNISRWAYQVLTEAVLEQAEIESALRQYAEAFQKKKMNCKNNRCVFGGPVKIHHCRKPLKKRNCA